MAISPHKTSSLAAYPAWWPTASIVKVTHRELFAYFVSRAFTWEVMVCVFHVQSDAVAATTRLRVRIVRVDTMLWGLYVFSALKIVSIATNLHVSSVLLPTTQSITRVWIVADLSPIVRNALKPLVLSVIQAFTYHLSPLAYRARPIAKSA